MTIRPAQLGDLNLIRSSWLQSYASSDWALLCTPKDAEHTVPMPCGHRELKTHRSRGVTMYHAAQVYWDGHRAVIERLLATCNVSVFAVDETMVDGWIVREWHRPAVHYLYVRASARGTGVAKALLDELRTTEGVEYTHAPKRLDAAKLPKSWVFNPYGGMR